VAKYYERIVKQLKKSHFSKQECKVFGISPSARHNIAKIFRESREISFCVG